jgi:hypothetical protein
MSTPSVVASIMESVRTIICRQDGVTVVVVCPDDGLHLRTFRRYAPVLLPEGASVSGHTVTRPDGSTVTFVGGSELESAPSGVAFSVEFVGWGTDVTSDVGMIRKWLDLVASVRSR